MGGEHGAGSWYLCYFLHRLLDYRIPEVESLAKLFGCSGKLQWRQAPNHHPDSPFYFVRLPSEDMARSIAKRSVLVKAIFEIWGEGSTYEELRAAVEAFPEEKKRPYLGTEVTFKIIVDTFGKVISSEEQIKLINSFDFIPFQGRVQLRDPKEKFWFMETDGRVINNGMPAPLEPSVDGTRLFFGREIGGADRSLVTKYALSTRKYLGPTAMDAEIACLMSNQALVDTGKFVYDPFVGTGSILVAAAHYGALTMVKKPLFSPFLLLFRLSYFDLSQGADIDLRVIRDGRGPDCNVWSNFKQYDLPPPVGLVRADNNARPWRPNLREVFDAIICDPPYGIRAGGRKSGGRKLLKGIIDPYIIPDDKRKEHIPSTAAYILEECVHDLLDMAAQLLVTGGRLVFFYPLSREEGADNKLPDHPCFQLVSSSEQILSTKYSRCLLTMEKTSEYTDDLAARALETHLEFKKNHAKLLDAKDKLRSLVFTPGGEVLQRVIPKYRGKYV
ncbi:tRNA (guanine(10)-N2)-methyltransferase homolog isoform X1 [Selaginella moellendorffii]|uniref:tRNA (guanine(10)-N2)-methyltransferase homolog isoform X1 n=1 Tax=Selaginella moellendorffii TaxID=88036 RepID=UPI000D1C61E2|nr:tRNA (guanine(10)-N2)-methyltransferase homolog isoform X1 [Selaginella moellendorffii]|eukprot:XP_024539201.1 tRNA (guanine(10)-N2)-methyltransferase homolog isoform X1 [Selaginella moellendorffii]